MISTTISALDSLPAPSATSTEIVCLPTGSSPGEHWPVPTPVWRSDPRVAEHLDRLPVTTPRLRITDDCLQLDDIANLVRQRLAVDRHLGDQRSDGHSWRLVRGRERLAVAAPVRTPSLAMTWTWTASPPGRPAESGIVTSVPVTSTAAGIHVSPSALHSTVNVIAPRASGSGSATSQCTVYVRADPIGLDLDGADRAARSD